MAKRTHKNDQAELNPVIQENIQTIMRHRRELALRRTLQERAADAITDFSGSMGFVYAHIVWFGLWIFFNSGRFGILPFDPFPYGLLTMIVSLEAIFLSTFVLIHQNRMSQESEERAELDLQINLLTERELTRVLQMLDEIQDKMGIENDSDKELTMLERETKPEAVLNEIEQNNRQKKG